MSLDIIRVIFRFIIAVTFLFLSGCVPSVQSTQDNADLIALMATMDFNENPTEERKQVYEASIRNKQAPKGAFNSDNLEPIFNKVQPIVKETFKSITGMHPALEIGGTVLLSLLSLFGLNKSRQNAKREAEESNQELSHLEKLMEVELAKAEVEKDHLAMLDKDASTKIREETKARFRSQES